MFVACWQIISGIFRWILGLLLNSWISFEISVSLVTVASGPGFEMVQFFPYQNQPEPNLFFKIRTKTKLVFENPNQNQPWYNHGKPIWYTNLVNQKKTKFCKPKKKRNLKFLIFLDHNFKLRFFIRNIVAILAECGQFGWLWPFWPIVAILADCSQFCQMWPFCPNMAILADCGHFGRLCPFLHNMAIFCQMWPVWPIVAILPPSKNIILMLQILNSLILIK